MADPEAVEAIKSLGLTTDEDQIAEALQRCNNNVQEAVQLLFPESPIAEVNINLMEGYKDVTIPGYNHQKIITQGGGGEGGDPYDVDMRDTTQTDTHPNSGADSDHDSTTVSYSLEEDTIKDIEEDEVEDNSNEGVGGIEEGVTRSGFSNEVCLEEEGGEFGGPGPTQGGTTNYTIYGQHMTIRHDGPPPRYEDIVADNQRDLDTSTPPPPLREEGGEVERGSTPIPQEMREGDDTTAEGSGGGGTASSIEFPLTHYYELEGRVHTDQWSIPYKREESLAICMLAAIKMVKEGG